jgi:photosystem II stability/assembly factor-like uncharacterized protein
MPSKTKKIFLVGMLSLVTVSFSGCLGISTNSTGTAAQRNDSQGVFKTTDGGKTWAQKVSIDGQPEFMLDQFQTISIAIDPDNTQILYLGTMGNGMYKTENGADSWHALGDQNGKFRNTASVYDIEVEQGNPSIVYAATLNDNRGVLMKTEDGGNSWTESYISTEPGKPIRRVQVDPVQKNIVYISTDQGGFLKSTDRGHSWQKIKWFQTGVRDFVVDYTNNKGIILMSHKGLYKTTDGGVDEEKSWQNLTPALTKFLNIRQATVEQITSLSIDNQNPLVIYITYDNFIFVSRDGGLTWDTLNTITPTLSSASNNVPEIKKIGLMNGTIYYGAGNALYRSDDKGVSWASFDIPILGDVKYTVSDPKDLNIIYVGALYVK